jgi:Predicted hydrolase of the HD superfamily (permuted catalytic motifs)
MLLPNTSSIKGQIDRLSKQINNWLLNQYAGEIGFVSASVKANQKTIMNYADLLKKLDDRLAAEKKQKFMPFLGDDTFWLEKENMGREIRVCRSCNITRVEKGVKEEICSICDEHKEIGGILPKTDYIAFLSNPNDSVKGVKISFGEFGVVHLLPGEEYHKAFNDLPQLLAIENINKVHDVFRFIGNTAPVANEEFVQETEEEEDGKRLARKGSVLTFETIADMSVGDKRIGILKMDVDNLGLIFGIGLPEGQKSISRIAALSRGMDWFFSAYLNEICKTAFEQWKGYAHKVGWKVKSANIENIFYIVYSGGDDLLIIGPWSEIPKLAKTIRDEFKTYSCDNKDINLSAGIFICKPKFPISIGARKAGEALEHSKDTGRNRITCLGDTAQWANGYEEECDFDQLLDFGENLYQAISSDDPNNRLPRGFVHGLLRKHGQYEKGEDLNFIPAIIYQMERNVKNNAKVQTLDGEKVLKKYLREKLIADKCGYFRKIKIPASYALLKSRKEKI